MEFRIIPLGLPLSIAANSELCGSTASLFSRALPQPRTRPPDHMSTRKTRRLEANLRRLTGPSHEPEKRHDG